MYPIDVPDSLLRLADATRPDHVEVGHVNGLVDRIQASQGLVSDWAGDERFWIEMCQNQFAQALGDILPHVTNGESGLAALIQSRTDVSEDPALKARKAVTQIPILLEDCCGSSIFEDAGMNRTSQLIQIIDDVFTAASGGLVMSANLITKGYPISVHSGILEAGAGTILVAVKNLKKHVKNLHPVIYG